MERHECVTIVRAKFSPARKVFMISHGQGAAVEGDHDWPHSGFVVMVNVRLDAERADFFANYRAVSKPIAELCTRGRKRAAS